MVTLNICTSDSWGGLELYACTLMSELKNAGTSVYAICTPNSKIEDYLVKHDIPFAHLPSYAKVSLKSVRFVRSLLDRHNVDVVQVHFHKDIWCASLALRNDRKRKLFLSVYMGINSKNDFLHRWIFKRVDGIYSSSQELNNRLVQFYPVPKEKIHLLPYGRQLERYRVNPAKRNEIRTQLGVSSDDVLFGTMGRIDPGKGVMDFAESYLFLEQELQKNVHYLIAGEPTRKGRVQPGESPFEPQSEAYLQQLTTFIAEHRLENRIHVVDFQENIVDWLSAMDVFAFPSRDEMYSIAVLDAMAMGLPIVAARAGGTLLQVTDNVNGLFYDVANSKDMAQKISIYFKSPDVRARHGNAARKFVEERHDMKKTLARLLELYTSN